MHLSPAMAGMTWHHVSHMWPTHIWEHATDASLLLIARSPCSMDPQNNAMCLEYKRLTRPVRVHQGGRVVQALEQAGDELALQGPVQKSCCCWRTATEECLCHGHPQPPMCIAAC